MAYYHYTPSYHYSTNIINPSPPYHSYYSPSSSPNTYTSYSPSNPYYTTVNPRSNYIHTFTQFPQLHDHHPLLPSFNNTQTYPHLPSVPLQTSCTPSITHLNSMIQKLNRSQNACIQAISNLASDVAKLNQSLTPPNLTHQSSNQYATLRSKPTEFEFQSPAINGEKEIEISTKSIVGEGTSSITDPNITIAINDFHVSTIDGKSTEAAKKEQGSEPRHDPPSTPKLQPLFDSPVRDSDSFNDFGSEALKFAPVEVLTKYNYASILPYRFTFVTSNDDNTLSGSIERKVLNHHISISNFERSFDFSVVCTFNFDPGGDKNSTATNSGGNGRISPLVWLPWDRGESGACNFLFPATALLPATILFSVKGAAVGAASGRPWVPWIYRIRASVCNFTEK